MVCHFEFLVKYRSLVRIIDFYDQENSSCIILITDRYFTYVLTFAELKNSGRTKTWLHNIHFRKEISKFSNLIPINDSSYVIKWRKATMGMKHDWPVSALGKINNH